MNKKNPTLSIIVKCLEKKFDLLCSLKVMSLSPMDNDITSISHMLDERQLIIDDVEELDQKIIQLIDELGLSEKTYVKNILNRQNNPQIMSDEMIDIDNLSKKIYNELNTILICNKELDEKLSFIKDNLVIQIKQINSNNQIFKYSNGTLGETTGSMLDIKH